MDLLSFFMKLLFKLVVELTQYCLALYEQVRDPLIGVVRFLWFGSLVAIPSCLTKASKSGIAPSNVPMMIQCKRLAAGFFEYCPAPCYRVDLIGQVLRQR
jgi:hypothetical protein